MPVYVNGSLAGGRPGVDFNEATDELIFEASNVLSKAGIEVYQNTGDTVPGYYRTYKSRGTYDSPVVVQAGDRVLNQGALAYDGTAYDIVASLRMEVQSISGGNIGGIYKLLLADTTGSATARHIIEETGWSKFVDSAGASPDQAVEIEEEETITGAVTDGYAAALRSDPGYTAETAQTVTRHNYWELQDVSLAGSGPAALTDACVMAFDAAAGTHKAVDSGTTKTTPGTVDAWLKVNINGTIYYSPLYTSKTT